FPRQKRDDLQSGRTLRRQILQRVDAELHLALREIQLELAREQPLPPDGGERFVEVLVARRSIGLELTRHAACLQRVLPLPRLTKRELRRACRDDQRGAGCAIGTPHQRATVDATPEK